MRLTSSAAAVAVAVTSLVAATFASANDNPFPSLVGSWSGKGEARLEGGKTEQMQCRGYYRGDGATGLGIAIRCANASSNIDLRAKLTNTNGKVSGNWEERTYNATGTVSGKASASAVDLAIDGGGLKASMEVAVTGGTHSVSIKTEGIGLKGVNITLARAD
jgi:hypothetical protein